MKQIDVLRLLPGPTQIRARLTCDEPTYQELIVLTALGFAEGKGVRGEGRQHLFAGRLTLRGVEKLAAMERRERGDG